MADDFVKGWPLIAESFGKHERHVRKVLNEEPWAQADRRPHPNGGRYMQIRQSSLDNFINVDRPSAVSSAHSKGGRASAAAKSKKPKTDPTSGSAF